MYHLYILYSKKFDKFYIGQTNNLLDRIKRHKEGRSKFTKKYSQWKLVYKEEYKTRSEAVKRESKLKSYKSKKYLKWLIFNNSDKITK